MKNGTQELIGLKKIRDMQTLVHNIQWKPQTH